VCVCVCDVVCPHNNSKTNDPKVFKLCIGNDLGIVHRWYDFGVKSQRLRLGFGLQKHIECDRVAGMTYAFCCRLYWFFLKRHIFVLNILYYTFVLLLSAYVPAAEDNKIVIPYMPSHLHHMMFELMKVSIVFVVIVR